MYSCTLLIHKNIKSVRKTMTAKRRANIENALNRFSGWCLIISEVRFRRTFARIRVDSALTMTQQQREQCQTHVCARACFYSVLRYRKLSWMGWWSLGARPHICPYALHIIIFKQLHYRMGGWGGWEGGGDDFQHK